MDCWEPSGKSGATTDLKCGGKNEDADVAVVSASSGYDNVGAATPAFSNSDPSLDKVFNL